jgi:hypothetical protein
MPSDVYLPTNNYRGPEAWRDVSSDPPAEAQLHPQLPASFDPSPEDQSKLFDFLGKINYSILKGDVLYIQSSGVAYRVLYGVYWQSVYNGMRHYLLRCEAIEEGMWMNNDQRAREVELPISSTQNGWTVSDQSLRLAVWKDFSFLDQFWGSR